MSLRSSADTRSEHSKAHRVIFSGYSVQTQRLIYAAFSFKTAVVDLRRRLQHHSNEYGVRHPVSAECVNY